LIEDAPVWLLDEMEKSFSVFYWAAARRANGGQCLVAWDQICKPYDLGGLGVKNMRMQGLALRSRWEWLKRTDPSKPWQGLQLVNDRKVQEVFDNLVRITVGNGRLVLFWRDKWIDGRSAAEPEIAPGVVSKVNTRARNSRSVGQALINTRWTADIQGTMSAQEQEASECVALWMAIRHIQLNDALDDQFSWPWSKTGCYTAKSGKARPRRDAKILCGER
jgi:hypothetical protein